MSGPQIAAEFLVWLMFVGFIWCLIMEVAGWCVTQESKVKALEAKVRQLEDSRDEILAVLKEQSK